MFGDKSKRKDIVATTAEPSQFMQMIEKIANNPKIDADTTQKILDMQLQVMDRTARDEFYAAMTRVQAALPVVMKDAYNKQTRSHYAKIETIAKAIKPIYTNEGFSMSFSQGKSDLEGYIRTNGILRHSAGHCEDHYYLDLPADNVGIHGKVNKTMVHATVSSTTYGRRCLTCMMFNVATDDDHDGNVPGETITEEQVANIEALISEVAADLPGLLKWQGVDSIESILAGDYKDVVAELESRR